MTDDVILKNYGANCKWGEVSSCLRTQAETERQRGLSLVQYIIKPSDQREGSQELHQAGGGGGGGDGVSPDYGGVLTR